MSEANLIFDALIKACDLDAKLHARDQKASQLHRVTKNRCGNCYHWMKSSCVPEKKGGQFKSSDSLGCAAFESCMGDLIKKFQSELDEINSEIVAITTPPPSSRP
jgi:hypothetical protein